MTPVEARFMASVDVTGFAPANCWIWTGRVTVKGYGQFSWTHQGSRTWSAHVASHLLFVGPVPDGLEIDHLCRNRRCVRPTHLEPVTHAENVRRAADTRRSEGHCRNGHALDLWGLYLDRAGTYRCMECARVARRKYNRKKQLEAAS